MQIVKNTTILFDPYYQPTRFLLRFVYHQTYNLAKL